MQVFNADVRLAGVLTNVVQKRGLTAPEIYVLRRIHGNDAVVNIKHVGDTEVDDDEERDRLHYEYGGGLASLGDDAKTSIVKMFGEFGPLLSKVKDYEGDLVDKLELLEEYQKPEIVEQADWTKIGRKIAAKKTALRLRKEKEEAERLAPPPPQKLLKPGEGKKPIDAHL